MGAGRDCMMAAEEGQLEWGRVLGTGHRTPDTGHWSEGGVIDCALFVAVIALPQMMHTHTQSEGRSKSFNLMF